MKVQVILNCRTDGQSFKKIVLVSGAHGKWLLLLSLDNNSVNVTRNPIPFMIIVVCSIAVGTNSDNKIGIRISNIIIMMPLLQTNILSQA